MTPGAHDSLQASLGDTLRIERELGGGGMSRVYVATDPALDRRVVVKVLSPELAQALSVERFTREIRLAAALQDSHIVPLLSAGTTVDGLPYYTMPYVEGESLRARLASGPLSLDEALRVLRDVAEALEYAHARGVVHRDIKPDNVLLAGRAAVVADFGIAKAMSAARTHAAPGGTLTQVGSSIGTPAYMAPEQAAGDPTDHRADLYSWGILAYELLAGAHPFAHKASTQQLIAAQIAEMPPALDTVRPGLPVSIGALVMRCLAKDPGKRPADASEVLSALSGVGSGGSFVAHARAGNRRTMLVAGAVAAAVIMAGGALWARARAAAPAQNANTLAVLPFEHQGDSAETYLTDGITDEIRGKLTDVHGLSVIARASSNQYRATTKSQREVARELGVRYLLTGTVRVVGSGATRRVLVRPELVEVLPDGRPESRWQQAVDAPATDLITVQGDVATRVVNAMEVAVGSADRARLTRVPTRDPVAYDLYLRGLAATNSGVNVDAASQRAAIPLFLQALERDSTMLEAWVSLTGARALLYANGAPSAKLADEARVAAERARALDPAGSIGRRALGSYYRLVLRDGARAMRELEAAYRANGGDVRAVNSYAYALEEAGRHADARRVAEESVRLDPRNSNTRVLLARLMLGLGEYEQARRVTAEAMSLAPASVNALSEHLSAVLAVGDTAAARKAIAEARSRMAPDALLANLGTFGMSWLFDAGSEAQLLTLGPDAYGDDRGTWALVKARTARRRGDSLEQRRWADTAARVLAAQAKDVPDNAVTRSDLAEALAYVGRATDALREASKSVALTRAQNDSRGRLYIGELMNAVISASLAGGRDSSIAWLTEVRAQTASYSPARLRVDPAFRLMRGDPRFEAMLAEPPR